MSQLQHISATCSQYAWLRLALTRPLSLTPGHIHKHDTAVSHLLGRVYTADSEALSHSFP